MKAPAERTAILAVLAVAAGALWSYPWLEAHRFSIDSPLVGPELLVTSPFDSGPGSLRAALFSALRSDRPAIIMIRPAKLVVQNPLPPLAGSRRIALRSERGRSEIDASALGSAPLFDIRAQTTTFENVAIRGAGIAAIRAIGNGELELRAVRISDSAVGVGIGDGVRMTVSGSEFADNRIGVELLEGGRAIINDTVFKSQRDAGLWVVRSENSEPSEARVTNTAFEGGRYGLVLGNTDAHVMGGTIRNFSADGILALGGSLDVSGAQLRDGGGSAIRANGLASVVIVDNEIYDVRGLGIMLQAASHALVEDNRLFRNGYGIATFTSAPAAVKVSNNLLIAQDVDGLVVLGDSPLVTGNRALRNRSAGIRVFNVRAQNSYSRASPLLVDNVLEGNGIKGPAFGEYDVAPAPSKAR